MPQKRAQLITNNTIQHTSGLLGINPVDIYGTRMLYSLLYCPFSNLIKNDAAFRLIINTKNMGQMPGNSFSLTVGVACQKDLF